MTDKERDDLLQGLAKHGEKLDAHSAKLDGLTDSVDSVSDGLQDMPRDLENLSMLPPVEHAEEAVG